MKIHLSNSAWIHNMENFIRSFDTSDESILEITSNKKWVSAHPVVLCMITGLALFMKEKGAKINFEPLEAKSKNYFEAMGLHKIIGMKSGTKIKKKDSTGRFIPLRRITNYDELTEFVQEIIPLYHSEKYFKPINMVISELVRNVFEHSGSEHGAIVCAQYHKDSKIIRIGVVDTGMGLEKALKIHNPKSYLHSILLALTPGITGTTRKIGGYSSENAGAGLFQIRALSKTTGNYFMIYSGKGFYKLLRGKKNKFKVIADPEKETFTSYNDLPFWHGTVVAIDLCLDDNLNFDEVLNEIWRSYRFGRKEQNKKKYKKPTFV